MARIRSLKPSFFKNEQLAECAYETRLLFQGLWVLADKQGVLEDRPKRIKVDIFPYDNIDINAHLDILKNNGFIVRYNSSESLPLIYIINFKKHQIISGTEVYQNTHLPLPKQQELPRNFQGTSKEIKNTSMELPWKNVDNYATIDEKSSIDEKIQIDNNDNLIITDNELKTHYEVQGTSKELPRNFVGSTGIGVEEEFSIGNTKGKEVEEEGGVGEKSPPTTQNKKKSNTNEPEKSPPLSAAPPPNFYSEITPQAIMSLEDCKTHFLEHNCMSRSREQIAMSLHMDFETLADWCDPFIAWRHVSGDTRKQLADFAKHFFQWMGKQDRTKNPKKVLETDETGSTKKQSKRSTGAGNVQSAFSRIDEIYGGSGKPGNGTGG